jgi:hypothetical protein
LKAAIHFLGIGVLMGLVSCGRTPKEPVPVTNQDKLPQRLQAIQGHWTCRYSDVTLWVDGDMLRLRGTFFEEENLLRLNARIENVDKVAFQIFDDEHPWVYWLSDDETIMRLRFHDDGSLAWREVEFERIPPSEARLALVNSSSGKPSARAMNLTE